MVEVSTQVELDAALKSGESYIDCVAGVLKAVITGSAAPTLRISAGVKIHVEAWESSQPHVVAWESSQPHVVAWGSSQPHVVAWGSSQPHVVAWESSQPHVEAWESSQPHVVAWESSQPHVEARGYVQLSIFGRVVAKCSAMVSVLIRGKKATVEGGNQTQIIIDTPAQWCDYYGVDVKDNVAILFKALDDNFVSPHDMSYAPGTTPVAMDWDGGIAECGGGLHFSPTPAMALEFNASAKRFVGCGVKLEDIVVHPDGEMPQKVKARAVSTPCFEVDRTGKAVDSVEHESKTGVRA